MKNKQDILIEIDELSESIMNNSLTENQEKKMRGRISHLRELIKYFDYNPTEDLLIKMRDDCVHKISVYNKRLEEWINSKSPSELEATKNPEEFYYREIAPKDAIELKSSKKQLSNINYLLND